MLCSVEAVERSRKKNAKLQRRTVKVLSRQDCGAACIPKENSRLTKDLAGYAWNISSSQHATTNYPDATQRKMADTIDQRIAMLAVRSCHFDVPLAPAHVSPENGHVSISGTGTECTNTHKIYWTTPFAGDFELMFVYSCTSSDSTKNTRL